MSGLREAVLQLMPLTMGEVFSLAKAHGATVTEVVLEESELRTGKSREETLSLVMEEYTHNLAALEKGLDGGESILFGTVSTQLNNIPGSRFFQDSLLDAVLLYTLAAQVGNHCIGLRPCAGTGDACPYAGFVKAITECGTDKTTVAEIAALILKIGGLFRVSKVTTGCNMEGFGAGAACIAAATVALEGGSPEQMERAMVLAISPTVGVPCTPRVLVPGLCASHICGGVLIGMFAARLCLLTDLEVNVPFDVMLAMVAQVHIESAHALVPTVSSYMKPFFKRKPVVEELVDPQVRQREAEEMGKTIQSAAKKAKEIAASSPTILDTLGNAVVGGSSQAVGSPTNTARIAHALAYGHIRKVVVDLCPELFARRSINVPGILMGAVKGASTADYELYAQAIRLTKEQGISVEIREVPDYGVQRVTIETDEMTCMVDALNRGGGRLTLRDALPSLSDAVEAAQRLGIVLV